MTVERSSWAADAARELLAPWKNCTVLGPVDATQLTPADLKSDDAGAGLDEFATAAAVAAVTGDGRFDCLVHELYGCVKCRPPPLSATAAVTVTAHATAATVHATAAKPEKGTHGCNAG